MTSSPTTTRAADVVFTFTFETFSDAVHRGMNRPPDRLLQTLLESDRADRVLVANPWRSGPARLARYALGRPDQPFPTTEKHSLVTPLRLFREEPADVPRLRALYERYDEQLRAAASRRGMERPAVITANPLVAGFSRFGWASATTFYARDDWAELPARQRHWPAIRAAYREMADSGIAVIAVSERILDRIGPTGPSGVVPNGVEPAEWAGPMPERPALYDGIEGPIALYVGTLDTRLDLEGLKVLAAARPELQIVLLGALGDAGYLAGIHETPNVHVRPQVSRDLLVAAIRHSDLCLVSHRRTALTEAMSPLKIYEYLAGGKPVLSIDLPPVRGIDRRVLLADSVADFPELVDEALTLGTAGEDERLQFVADNSWKKRHSDILDVALRNR
ncbi:glycosyltransferase family 1 protein [Amnibacterium flavum]|uniref:glycosyltransferase family 1 protein n=1 Tax=Amnibacterium flavum TaxID=2173173 RepID=UPI001403E05B|nr:glycosyltransferase family 1 protein [Amnibacterium flavum]